MTENPTGRERFPKAREGSTASLAGLTLLLAAPVTYGQWMTLEHRWSGGQSVDGVEVGAQMEYCSVRRGEGCPTGRWDPKAGCGSAREAGTLLTQVATGETPIALGDYPSPQALQQAPGCRVI